MAKLLALTTAVLFLTGAHAQSYGSPSSSSYGSPAAASPSFAASPASSSSALYQYPSINLPLLSFPAAFGNATLSNTAAAATTTVTGTTGTVSNTNYLASLPTSAITNLAPYTYAFGTYANDYDASRDAQYNNSQQYAFNQYTTNLTGYGALNLSNPVAVAAANWWSPYPYQLAAWNDGYTTQGSVAATTAASVNTATGTVLSSNTYYAAYGGNINGLGVAGLGLSVPGAAPNVAAIQPGLSYAYNTGVAAAPAAATNTATSMQGSSAGYAAAPMASPSSGYSSPSSGYGRK